MTQDGTPFSTARITDTSYIVRPAEADGLTVTVDGEEIEMVVVGKAIAGLSVEGQRLEHDEYPVLVHTEAIPTEEETSPAFKQAAVQSTASGQYNPVVGVEFGGGFPLTVLNSRERAEEVGGTHRTITGNPAFKSKEEARQYMSGALAEDVKRVAPSLDLLADKRVGVLNIPARNLLRSVVNRCPARSRLLTGGEARS